MQTLYGGAHSAIASINGQECNVCIAVYLITIELLLCIHLLARPCLWGCASSRALCAEQEWRRWKLLKESGTGQRQALSPLCFGRGEAWELEEVEKGQRAWDMARKLQKARILPFSSTQALLSFSASVAPFTWWLVQLAVKMTSHRRLRHGCFSSTSAV